MRVYSRAAYAQDVELGDLAHPEASEPVPGVVLVHDVWGMAEHARNLVRRLASEGFAVLAVDLSRRLERVRASLADRKWIERAKGQLMKRRGLDEQQAYDALPKLAMQRNCRIVEVARALLGASAS